MTKAEAGRIGGKAPHERRGFSGMPENKRKQISATGVQKRANMKMVREVDDLEIVVCPRCRGTKKGCRHCNGTGDIVVKKIKFYERGTNGG